MKQLIYADNAATTKLDPIALEAMMPWLTDEYGNASQPYSFARGPKRALLEARETIAACLNAEPHEILFTSGGTESDNWVIKSIRDDNPGKAIVTSAFEHHAVLYSCEAAARVEGAVIHVKPTRDGVILPSALDDTLPEDSCLVSIMFSNNEIGTIQPIKELSQIAHSKGALFHTDAVQAVGHVPIDVKELGIDFLSSSAHKYNGPKGIGFLYIKSGTPIKPYNNGGAQEFGMRAGTENIASIVGMATALKLNCDAMHDNEMYLLQLESALLQTLNRSGIDYRKNGGTNHVPGNMSLSFHGADGEMLLHRLDLMGICVSTGSACDSKNTQISHVLKAIDLPEEYAKGTIRVSLGKYNTVEEAQQIANAIVNILKA